MFKVLSIVAIAIGGLLSAYRAKQITRTISWVSAYLVIVLGLIQLGIVSCWQALDGGSDQLFTNALLMYNLGALLVLIGRLFHGKLATSKNVLIFGSILVIFAALLIAQLTITKIGFSWDIIWLMSLLAIATIGAVTGLILNLKKVSISSKDPR